MCDYGQTIAHIEVYTQHKKKNAPDEPRAFKKDRDYFLLKSTKLHIYAMA